MLQNVGVGGDLREALVHRLVNGGVLQALPEPHDLVAVTGEDHVQTPLCRARANVVHHLQGPQGDD